MIEMIHKIKWTALSIFYARIIKIYIHNTYCDKLLITRYGWFVVGVLFVVVGLNSLEIQRAQLWYMQCILIYWL